MVKRGLQWSWLLPLAWMAILFYFLTKEISTEPPTWAFPHIDKVVHFGFFAILSWLWFIPAQWTLDLTPAKAASLGFVLASVYGGLTEYIQSTIPYRDGNLWDVLANSIGAATVFVPLLQRWCTAILSLVHSDFNRRTDSLPAAPDNHTESDRP